MFMMPPTFVKCQLRTDRAGGFFKVVNNTCYVVSGGISVYEERREKNDYLVTNNLF